VATAKLLDIEIINRMLGCYRRSRTAALATVRAAHKEDSLMRKSPRYIKVQILTALGLLFVGTSSAIAQAAQPAASNFKVTLLGTSTPNPLPDRFGPSTLVEAGIERLLFDCGRGATIRLWQLKIPLGTVKLRSLPRSPFARIVLKQAKNQNHQTLMGELILGG
jgi:hypothetical protein